MFYKIIPALLIMGFSAVGQEPKMEWNPDHKITIDDFKAPQTTIGPAANAVHVQSGVGIEFALQMNNIEFMFTKNFNPKVVCTFQKEAATLTAPDSLKAKQLIHLIQYDYDLSELYTRKIRKELYENKKTFSNVTFFQPYFDKMIAERNAASSKVYAETDFGTDTLLLEEEHKAVLKEIQKLSDYCKVCKPPKKGKKQE